jgi:hypothetical protein
MLEGMRDQQITKHLSRIKRVLLAGGFSEGSLIKKGKPLFVESFFRLGGLRMDISVTTLLKSLSFLIGKYPTLKVKVDKTTLLPRSGNYKGWVATVHLTIINPTGSPILIYDNELKYCKNRYKSTNMSYSNGSVFVALNSTKFPLQVPAKGFVECKLYYQTDYSYDGRLKGELFLDRGVLPKKKVKFKFQNT